MYRNTVEVVDMKSAKILVEVLCRITELAIMRRFFSEIFTPAEIDDFVLR